MLQCHQKRTIYHRVVQKAVCVSVPEVSDLNSTETVTSNQDSQHAQKEKRPLRSPMMLIKKIYANEDLVN